MSPLLAQIARWPAHELEVTSFDAEALDPRLWEHFATSAVPSDQSSGLHVGATVWVSRQPNAAAAIAWEWAELQSGVLALSDPNALISNIQVISAPVGMDGLDPAGRKRLVLNAIVHALPWQSSVLAELGTG